MKPIFSDRQTDRRTIVVAQTLGPRKKKFFFFFSGIVTHVTIINIIGVFKVSKTSFNLKKIIKDPISAVETMSSMKVYNYKCIFMYIHIYVLIYIHVYIYIYICMYINMYIYIYIYIYINTQNISVVATTCTDNENCVIVGDKKRYINVYICKFIYLYICMYMDTFIYIRLYICIY
jgi:hypothetical protein